MEIYQSDVERFKSKCVAVESGCLEWRGARYTNGYGQFSMRRKDLKRKTYSTHRIALLIAGEEIPDGMMICHTCDNRICVNPEHLYVGTGVDNNRDTVKRERGNRVTGERCSWSKLKDEEVRFIKASASRTSDLAKMFRVHQSLISQIRHGKRWAWLKA